MQKRVHALARHDVERLQDSGRRGAPIHRLRSWGCQSPHRASTAPLSCLDVRIDERTELVIAVDIAKRLGMSSQRVYVLATGPSFPKPLGTLGRSAVWRWSSVERWARDTGRLLADDAAA